MKAFYPFHLQTKAVSPGKWLLLFKLMSHLGEKAVLCTVPKRGGLHDGGYGIDLGIEGLEVSKLDKEGKQQEVGHEN